MKQNNTVNHDVISSVKEILNSNYFKESSILDLLPTAVYVCDASGVIINYNRKAAQLWGRNPVKSDKTERFCGALRLYLPDGKYLPHNETPVAVCLIDGLPRENVELIIERPDLSRIITRVNVVPIKDERGTILGAINCFNDITEEKQTQKQSDWKTKQLQDYVDNAAIGLHWVDANGIIKWANSAELKMLGYTEEEYIGQHISKFHVRPEKIDDILNRLSCNEILNQYESELRCKDGSVRTVHISSNVLWDKEKFVHTRCFTTDVTEEKKLFHALKKSEGLYKTLVNSLPAAIYTCDKEGKITFFNELAVQLWGYTPDIDEDSLRFCACYKMWMSDGTFVPPDKTPMAVTLQTGQSFRNGEALVERPDGSKFYACVNIDPLLDENNGIIGAINVFQDITNIKQTEIALRESESRYRKLIHSLDTPLYTTDAEGRITLYNKAASDLWGREPEIGKDLWCGSYKIFKTDGSDLPLDSCPMAVCLKEQRPVHGEEILVMRPDGSLRNVAPHPQPLFDDSGSMIGAINMLIDVTELKHTERALRESDAKYRELALSLEKKVEEKILDLQNKNEQLKRSEERYHKMVEEVEDYAIILLDKDGIIQNWNRGAEKIKGYKEEEIVGKSFSNFYLSSDRDSDLPQRILNDAREKGKALHEGWRMRKDGSIFWGSIVLTALHDNQKNIIGFSKVTRDLTERKLAEDRLREYTSQLEFQNKELEQFAYAASHDMKEPLRKIHLYNSSIAQNPANILDEKSKEFLTRSTAAVKRMTELIEDLLTYSKTTVNLESFEEVNLTEIVDEIMIMHKEELEQKNVSINTENLPVIHAIPFQVKQLLFNLINNSIKYKHPDRDVDIELKAKVVKGSEIIEHDAEQNKNYQKISVIDNGIGFAPQYAEKIFNIFQRLNNHPSSAKGSGIGLSICKRIIQNHHGFIKATGKENAGARFDIYLPTEL
jgi:PAS domain S-box-containing protein